MARWQAGQPDAVDPWLKMLAISFICGTKKRVPKASLEASLEVLLEALLGRDPEPQSVGHDAHGADTAEPQGDEPQQPLRQRSRIWPRRRQ
jgi:hypothetical protein